MDDPSAEIVNLYWTISGDGGQDIVAYRVEVSDTANQWPNEDTDLPETLDDDRQSDESLALKDTDDTDGPMVAVIGVDPDQPTGGEVSYDLQHTVPSITEDVKLYYRVRVETESSAGNNRKVSAYTMGDIDLTAITVEEDYTHGDKNPSAPVLGPDGIEANDSPTDHILAGMDSLTDDDVVPGEVTLTVKKSELGGSDSYRVDISDDGGETWSMVHSSTRPINQTEYEHQGLEPSVQRSFRIFTKKGSAYGVASNVATDYSAHSHEPGKVRALTATADGAGKINLTWNAPEDNGGAMIDKYCIIAEQVNDLDPRGVIGNPYQRASIDDDTGIRVVDRTVDDDDTGAPNCARFSLPKKASIKLSANGIYDVAVSTTSVMFTGLDQETRWQFQVFGLNDATVAGTPTNAPDLLKGVAKESETEDAKTTKAVVPGAPKNLTAELARDTNFTGIGSRGVLVLWNAPSDPAGAPVVGYKIERKIDDGEYEEKVSSGDAGTTHWVDTNEPAEGEVRMYRVTSINAAGVGTLMAMVTIPLGTHTTHPPAAASDLGPPTMVEAMSDTAGEVTIEWTDGANSDRHIVALFDSEWGLEDVGRWNGRNANVQSRIDAGTYNAVVISVKDDANGKAVDINFGVRLRDRELNP